MELGIDRGKEMSGVFPTWKHAIRRTLPLPVFETMNRGSGWRSRVFVFDVNPTKEEFPTHNPASNSFGRVVLRDTALQEYIYPDGPVRYCKGDM